MIKDSNIKKRNIINNNDIYNCMSPMKYKRLNLISLKKSIIIPIPSFNSLTKCTTNNKSNSFSGQIPLNAKNKFIPSIKKFNDSNDKNSSSFKLKRNNNKRNANIKSLKILFQNKKNILYLKKSYQFTTVKPNTNRVSSISNNINSRNIVKYIKNEKSTSPFNSYNLDNNLSIIHKKANNILNRNIDHKIKISSLTMGIHNSSIKNGGVKSIFNKKNTNIKYNIFNEIKKDGCFQFKNKKVQKMKIKNINEINEDNNDNKHMKRIINKKNVKNNNKFIKSILENNGVKIKKIDIIKNKILIDHQIIIKEKQIKMLNSINKKINKNNIITNGSNNINKSLKNLFYKKMNIFDLNRDNVLTNNNINRKIKTLINIKGII